MLYRVPARYRFLLYTAVASLLLSFAVAAARLGERMRVGTPCSPGRFEALYRACVELTGSVDVDGRSDTVLVYLNGRGELCWVLASASGPGAVQPAPASCQPVITVADKP